MGKDVDARHLKGGEVPEQREQENAPPAAHVEEGLALPGGYDAMQESKDCLHPGEVILHFEVMVFLLGGLLCVLVPFPISLGVCIQKGSDILLFHFRLPWFIQAVSDSLYDIFLPYRFILKATCLL